MRQVDKRCLVNLAEALGLEVAKDETTHDLFLRCLTKAHTLRILVEIAFRTRQGKVA